MQSLLRLPSTFITDIILCLNFFTRNTWSDCTLHNRFPRPNYTYPCLENSIYCVYIYCGKNMLKFISNWNVLMWTWISLDVSWYWVDKQQIIFEIWLTDDFQFHHPSELHRMSKKLHECHQRPNNLNRIQSLIIEQNKISQHHPISERCDQ